MTNSIQLSLLLLLVGVAAGALALDNGLARTPPMGWMAWERFTCTVDCKNNPSNCIDDYLFRSAADRMAEEGYKERGYSYINIDDCWSELRRDNATARLVPDQRRFSQGILGLADYIHSKGLKLGIYGDCGTKTCAGYPGQLKPADDGDNYFAIDAQTLGDWQVDSFKFDGCNIDPLKAESICPQMTAAIAANAQRPILITCEWPFYMNRVRPQPAVDYQLAQRSCNMWRYYEDVEDSWLSILSIVDFTVSMQATISQFHGPGNWFDPDQLIIGNFGLSPDQARAQMALWCVWSAPLMMGNDLRDISPPMRDILLNEQLIGVDQDRLGVFGMMVKQEDEGRVQMFVKPVEPIRNSCPSFVVVYLYRETLGNRREVAPDVRELLSKSLIGTALRRYQTLDASGPTASACKRRIVSGMTKLRPKGADLLLPMNPAEQDADRVEEQSIVYQVSDLFGDPLESSEVSLDGKLALKVNPSGVRAVKLTEKLE